MGIKQPRVGYINPKTLEVEFFDDGDRDTGALEPVENIHSNLVRTVVNRMTRVMLGAPVRATFVESLVAFQIFEEEDEAERLISGINKGLDDNSIINAVKLTGLGVVFREPVEKINPNEVTIQNVRMMVERSFHFVKDVEREASDSFWDIKISEALPTKEDIRELLRRWCAQPCSVREQRCYLSIYNPRLNEVYRTRADAIPDDVITEFEKTL